MALWTTTTITDTQRGLRYRSGRLVGFLGPGKHTLFWPTEGDRDQVFGIASGFTPWSPELARVVPAGEAELLEVGFGELATLRVDGIPTTVLKPGRWLLWQVRNQVEAEVYDTTALRTSIPEELWSLVPGELLQTVVVHPYEKVVMFVDGDLHQVLAEGRHGFHTTGRVVTFARVDQREQELQIAGQEVMTADKVTLRVNLLVHFQVVDPARALSAASNVRDLLYSTAQLASRRMVAGQRLDQLLERRNDLASEMLAVVKPRATAWGVEVIGLDVKDVVLPGDMKLILNQVIQAEKQAAANVILRREETAATRSLANTARLLEANPTLMRLKELEALEKIADHVGDVTLVTTPEALVGQLKMT
jgi:regulator of protease activity HflC (stomatin/prohibitin superfamily)